MLGPLVRLRRFGPIGWLEVFGLLALGTRVALACVSIGSNDVWYWHHHGVTVLRYGVGGAYAASPIFNHPPLMGLWAALGAALCVDDLWRFSLWVKAPGLLAELGSALLLRHIGRRRSPGGALGSWLFAGYGTCLTSLTISGYHGNTDPLLAFLCLLAAYLLEQPTRPFAAGLALAAALNVKLMPLVLVPCLALSALGTRKRQVILRFGTGLALGLVPFAVVATGHGAAVASKLLQYNSEANSWGLNALFNTAAVTPPFAAWLAAPARLFREQGRYLVLVLAAAPAVAQLVRPRWSTTELAALAAAAFLLFTPGFGVQYLVFVCPLLFAAHPKGGALFGLTGGLFLAAIYLSYGVPGAWPLQSNFDLGPFRPLPVMLGVIAWTTLLAVTWRLLVGADRAARAFDGAP